MLAGRTTELLALEREVNRHRLVTVTGEPGIGKSALVHEFAKTHSAPVVGLAEAKSADEIAREIGRALGLLPSPASIGTAIARALANRRRALVVLDDADRARKALASVLEGWLRDAPSATFVVTSRTRLGLGAERRIELGPLEVQANEGDSPAAKLFAERAASARDGFRLTAANRAAIASIVAQLEGVPLAIELCAARVASLPLSEIESLLAERLDLLEGEERSIRGAFALSWDELDDEDARLLAACSIFRGGFTLDAACAVGGGAVDVKDRVRIARALERLIERSLLRTDGSRYTMTLTLRAFAKEKLEDRATVEERHARFFSELHRRTPRVPVDALAADQGNLEDAAAHALAAGDPKAAAGTLLSLAPVALARGPLRPFVTSLGKVLEGRDVPPRDRAELHLVRGLASIFAGKRDTALDDLERARALAKKANASRVEALATSRLALVQGMKGRIAQAKKAFADAERAAKKAKDEHTHAVVLRDLANVLSEAGLNDDAVLELGRARSLFHSAGDVREEGFVLMMLGSRFADDGRLDAAKRDCTAALALLEQAGDRRSQAWTLAMLALVDAESGDLSSARTRLEKGLAIVRDVGDEHTEGLLLLYLGNVALEQSLLEDAERAYHDAIARLRHAGDEASEAMAIAGAALVDHAFRRGGLACEGIARARKILARNARKARLEAVEVLASLVEGHPPPPPQEGEVEEIRFARRAIEVLSAEKKPARSALVIANDGSAFRLPGAEPTRLGKTRAIARVLHRLAVERLKNPGRAVTPPLLVGAGWPGERMLPSAAKNRLHVTIARLRKVGLLPVLLHDDEGYFLDPKTDLKLSEPSEL